jgi:hypothetical protein
VYGQLLWRSCHWIATGRTARQQVTAAWACRQQLLCKMHAKGNSSSNSGGSGEVGHSLSARRGLMPVL